MRYQSPWLLMSSGKVCSRALHHLPKKNNHQLKLKTKQLKSHAKGLEKQQSYPKKKTLAGSRCRKIWTWDHPYPIVLLGARQRLFSRQAATAWQRPRPPDHSTLWSSANSCARSLVWFLSEKEKQRSPKAILASNNQETPKPKHHDYQQCSSWSIFLKSRAASYWLTYHNFWKETCNKCGPVDLWAPNLPLQNLPN